MKDFFSTLVDFLNPGKIDTIKNVVGTILTAVATILAVVNGFF